MANELYFGAPGALVEIPHPRGGVQESRVRPTSVFTTASGGARSSRTISGKRKFTLNWQQLWYSTYATIEAYSEGHNGPGPFVLHDPGRVNWLTVNQSSATSHRNDTDGFSLTASGYNMYDNFTRSAASGWGTATTGQVWSVNEGIVADALVNGTRGVHSHRSLANLSTNIDIGNTDQDTMVLFQLPAIPTGTAGVANCVLDYRFKWSATNRHLANRIVVDTAGTATHIFRRVGPSGTIQITSAVTQTIDPSAWYGLRSQCVGSAIKIKFWRANPSAVDFGEPTAWGIETTDSDLAAAAGTQVSILTVPVSVTNTLPFTWQFDMFISRFPTTFTAISSSSTLVNRGPRALKWEFNFATTLEVPVLTILPATTTWPGIAIIQGQNCIFNCVIRGAGTDPIVTFTPKLEWRDTAGAVLSTTAGAPVASSSGAWQNLTVSGTPPANAAFVLIKIEATSGIGGAGQIYFDLLQLERGLTATTWRPGTGVFPVQITSINEQWPWKASDYRESPTLVLQEVGP